MADTKDTKTTVAVVRRRLAQLIWLACVGCALLLASGALLVALDGSATNSDNELYQLVVSAADAVDFDVLSRENGLFDFGGPDGDAQDVLANWGLAAIVWLVIGRVADRLVRP